MLAGKGLLGLERAGWYRMRFGIPALFGITLAVGCAICALLDSSFCSHRLFG